jgi:FkbM family methyltransferase
VLVDISHPSVSDQVRASLFFGMYEGAERRAVRRFLDEGLPTIELGASIGVVTCLIAQRSPAVVAVEADARLLPVAKHNLWLNGLDCVSLVHAAVSYQAGNHARFLRGSDTTTGRMWAGEASGAGDYVPTVTLERLVNRFSFRRYALVCDIEGAEAALITHESQEVLDRCQSAILELHDTHYDGRAFTALQLGDIIGSRTGMRLVFSDGKVWVFRR